MSASECLARVRSQLEAAAARCHRPVPRLVAVSKTKPVEAVLDVYAAGQRHFGENYVQELVDKAPLCPPDVRWHFIGQLQSNKAKPLVMGVPNLWVVESVDSEKLAGKLQAAAAAAGRGVGDRPRLRVLIQVNTSEEPQKGGVEDAAQAAALACYVAGSCPALQLAGLMTIGKLGEVAAGCFERLVAARAAVARELGVEPGALELSMGMSGDFELATEHGSDAVRVGSAIFGAREYPARRGAPAPAAAAAVGEVTSAAGGDEVAAAPAGTAALPPQ